MSTFPYALDTDAELPRVDDDITEVGGLAINALRDAVFALEKELGITPAGSAGSVATRLNVSFNADGTIKASALTSVGLATLPIVDNQVGTNAGIKEYKLALDYSTSDLHTLIVANGALLNSLTAFANVTSSNLNTHIAGGTTLIGGSSARHVGTHIDLNAVPFDSRDPAFVWQGLKDKNGTLRTATTVGGALDQINTDLTTHENAVAEAHHASAITVDVSGFTELPETATDVQKALDAIDDLEVSNIGLHRATQHANGIPRAARSQAFNLPDGYRENVVPVTPVITYLVNAPNTMPVDDLSVGDDLIKFNPADPLSTYAFDAQFSQVRIGDIVRVNYGNSIEVAYMIESIRYIPGQEWIVRINGVNLFNTNVTAFARIDRPRVDTNTAGILAVAAANATPTGSFTTLLTSVIVGNPRGAMALGLGFDPGQLDSTHYNLYLQLYPSGNPVDKVISLPAIDVTGNLGVTPGKYTLQNVVQATNNAFRKIGYNYRFIAFAHDGEFGIMLADAINGASFSIVNGDNSSGTLIAAGFTNNVVDGTSTDDFDALGFGTLGADLASPAFQSTWTSLDAAQIPTKVIVPLQHRDYVVNGRRRDTFAATYLANADGYWDGYISARTPVGLFTVEITYTVLYDLKAAELKPGKTIVVQPAISFSDTNYFDVDYGRFIIKSVNFIESCGGGSARTEITVINGIHASGSGFGFSSSPPRPVRLYFSEDSVGFNSENVINQTPTTLEHHRLHEIYINDQGKTFSHERARLPRQTEDSSPSFLGTDKWHVLDVSPKLRGHRDSSILTFNKYVRLYILTYNSTSGEFDGYLGRRASSSSTNIVNTGIVVTGRKNVPVRFYDETNVDYIEVMYEDGSSPGTNILSTASPRFVDIEIFPTLRTNDENLLLATCEVNWDPASGQDVIERVIDRRNFGSIAEDDFTAGAVDFITAGDRLLHENGIVRGFVLDSINPSDNRELYFSGGIALVNGKIVAANNGSVNIPQVSPFGQSLPQDVTWAVCVNEDGNFIPILITSTKTQYFATPGSGNYYLPSVTFTELVNTRKDLTPIYLVTATIASITITEENVKDIRRFVANQGLAHPLVLSTSDLSGHFHTFDAVKNWINNYGSAFNLIRVRGDFTISSSVDFSSLSQPATIEGDGGTITVTAAKGILLGSNQTYRNLKFDYAPTGITYTTGDLVNRENGCFFGDPDTSLSNIYFDQCVFSCSLAGSQRPPFINFLFNKADIVDTVKINKCNFNDSSTTQDQAAIAFITNNDGVTSDPAVITDLLISGNVCDKQQAIYVTTFVDVGTVISRAGLNAINCVIENNSCGAIGYCVSSARHSSTSSIKGFNRLNSLTIKGNTCNYIGSLDHTGLTIGQDTGTSVTAPYGTGNIIISGNYANWIQCQADESTSNFETSSLLIENNILEAYDSAYLLSRFNANNINAISVKTNDADSGAKCSIVGNSIDFGRFGSTTYGYSSGISTSLGSIIKNNIIKGISDNVGGTVLTAHISLTPGNTGGVSGAIDPTIITGNQCFRHPDNDITAFIRSTNPVFGSNHTSPGIIVDNLFDSPYIDSDNTDSDIFASLPVSFVVERNINQTITVNLDGTSGLVSLSVGSGNYFQGLGKVASFTSATTEFSSSGIPFTTDDSQVRWKADATGRNFMWAINLHEHIPHGAQVTEISIFGERTNESAAFSDASTTTLKILHSDFSGTDTFDWDDTDEDSHTFTINPTANTCRIVPNSTTGYYPRVVLTGLITDSSEGEVTFSNFAITYRW